MVLLVRFPVPLLPLKMPPPPLPLPLLAVAELPEMVELRMLTVPKALAMPPPILLVELPEMVLLMIVVPAPMLAMPPLTMLPATLPEMAQAATVKLVPNWLEMAPPKSAFPLAMVSLEMVLKPPEVIWKIPKLVLAAALRCTVNKFAPGPLIVIALLINNASLVRLIGLITLEAKVIVSPSQALAKMERSEPGPLSLLLVTTVLPQPGSWSA